jgi:hypothetical protein
MNKNKPSGWKELEDYIYRRLHIVYSRAYGNGTVGNTNEEKILTDNEVGYIVGRVRTFISQEHRNQDKLNYMGKGGNQPKSGRDATTEGTADAHLKPNGWKKTFEDNYIWKDENGAESVFFTGLNGIDIEDFISQELMNQIKQIRKELNKQRNWIWNRLQTHTTDPEIELCIDQDYVFESFEKLRQLLEKLKEDIK